MKIKNDFIQKFEKLMNFVTLSTLAYTEIILVRLFLYTLLISLKIPKNNRKFNEIS